MCSENPTPARSRRNLGELKAVGLVTDEALVLHKPLVAESLSVRLVKNSLDIHPPMDFAPRSTLDLMETIM